MPRITVSIDESHADHIAAVREEIDADSDAEAVREIFDRAMNADARLKRADERVQRLEADLAQAEAERDEERHKTAARLDRLDEREELVAVVDREQSLAERRARAGLFTRARWFLTGVPDDSDG